MKPDVTDAEPDLGHLALDEAWAAMALDGFCRVPRIIPSDLLARARDRMEEAVVAGDYERGASPLWAGPGTPATILPG
jgi:hypothetical protein